MSEHKEKGAAQAEFQERVKKMEALIAPIMREHNVAMTARLDYSPNGIVPVVAFADTTPEEEVTKK